MKRLVYILSLLSCSVISAQKENKIEILNANTIEYDKDFGNGAQRLIGDVRFRHENMLMNCDSAYYYSENDSLHAFGNIHMIQGDTLHLYGKFLRYDGNTKIAQVRKNVRMIDRDITLTTEFLDYDLNTKVGFYFNGGNIINKENHLKSEKGYYHSTVKTFHFRKKVFCTNDRDTIISDTLQYNTVSRISYFFGPTEIFTKGTYIYCEDGWYNTATDISRFSKNSYMKTKDQKLSGDSLFYDGKMGIGRALNHVTILDTTRNMILTGNYGYFIRDTEYSFMTDSAVLINYDNKDSLFMHSDTIISYLDTNGKSKIMKAFHKVCFYRSDLQGKCDSAVYTQVDSTLHMYVVPILWSDENQLTGEYIEMMMMNGHIDRAKLYTTPFIVSKEDSVRFNQIRGKLMTGYFKDNHLYKILVNGNGQTIYYPKDGNDIIGINKAECSDLIIHIDSNKVRQIDFITKPDATLYPLDQGPEELMLKGFVWYNKLRPLRKEDIFIYKEMELPAPVKEEEKDIQGVK